jgi:hypothetical protein
MWVTPNTSILFMNSRLLIITILALVFACKEKQAKGTPEMEKLDAFIRKEKFVQDASVPYPGISDRSLRLELTGKINQAAEDFKAVAQSTNPAREQYLQKIRIGLKRFDGTPAMYDTEDRERICHYFEELMDIVGLPSSEGMLNGFMYGFDPK